MINDNKVCSTIWKHKEGKRLVKQKEKKRKVFEIRKKAESKDKSYSHQLVASRAPSL